MVIIVWLFLGGVLILGSFEVDSSLHISVYLQLYSSLRTYTMEILNRIFLNEYEYEI